MIPPALPSSTEPPTVHWGPFQPLVDAVTRRLIDGFFLRGMVIHPDCRHPAHPDATLIPLACAGGFLFLSPRFLEKRQLSSPQVVATMLQDQTFRFLQPADAFLVGPNLKQDLAQPHFLQVDLGQETHVFFCPPESGREVLDLARSIFSPETRFRLVSGPVPPIYELRQFQPMNAFAAQQGTRPYALAAVGVVVAFLFMTAVVLAFQLPILVNVIAFIGCALVLMFLVDTGRQQPPSS